jgi:NADH:ubiquinone oxidoreductase subunit 2 (subunit N)
MALALKIGVAPFHFWFPQITKNMKWSLIFILFSWQKIAPLFLIASFSRVYIISFLALSSAILGAWGGINQSNFKLILTFSSIAHRGWLIMLINSSISLTSLYFSVYIFYSSFYYLNFLLFKKKNIKKKI